MEISIMLSFVVYAGSIAFIALSALQHQRAITMHGSSFIVGGRSLNYWVTALSAHAADMSDWLFMGLPGAVYAIGSLKIWVAISLVIGMSLCWHFVAKPLRIATEKYESYTLSSFFQKRFNDTSGIISIACASVILFFFTIYLAVGIKGAGYILNTAFGIPYKLGAFLGTLLVVLYAALGGYIAVAWIDAFQAIFLLGAIIITPLVAFMHVGGIQSIVNAAAQKGISLSLFPNDWRSYAQIILDPMGWALGYFGMPHILSKFMGTRNPQELTKAKYIGIIWQICALSAAVMVGLVGLAYFSIPLANPELIFIRMTTELFVPFVAGLILCGILAATFSTMDSQLLVLAGIVTDDIYKQFINKKASVRQTLLVYQLSIVVASVVAFFIVYDEKWSTIFGLVEYAWSGIGASFGPLVLLSLYNKRINKYGARAGIIAGGVTSALWKYFNYMPLGISVNAIIPGFIIGFFTIYCISIITTSKNI